VRPWLDWRTIKTPNYQFHFPRELEGWTRSVAQEVESIDSTITSLVGHSARRPIHVVVDDPFSVANGGAIPVLDRPTTLWWAMPPDPRSGGNYRTWGELLAVHELTHLAHMTRPSRNRTQALIWQILPAKLGPITRKAPRWVYEGYATVIEGRVTGSGRPNSVWRPAILRQWAIEGRLPTYAQLTAWDDFQGGGFAYMGGSAFLEWLTQREGDSSLVQLWRRLTARRVRNFDEAFRGVFGDSPALLYGRHAAELTRDAMLANAALERAGLVEGELIQRLTWATGDPAVSPNGERVAIMLRERDRPGRIVIWKTTPEPEDTAAARKRAKQLAKDPEDVPDRRFYPVSKKAVKTLHASNGRSYQMPRWFADNRRVLVTRWTPRPDGTLRPDLFVWDTESGRVRRATHGSAVLHGDPHPNGREAVAMQCHRGHCDIARVDLARGAMTTLLEGDPQRSYYHPRYTPDGSRFVASVSDSGRWRVLVADRDGTNVRYVDPEDGANRYDAQWLRGGGGSGGGGDTLVVVSDRGGIPNIELLGIADRSARTLTRVTGAAVGPDVDARDGSIWFLTLHSRGLDLRRLARVAPAADSAVAITADRFGFAGLRSAKGLELDARPLGESRSYGGGPRHLRWLPSVYSAADGGGRAITFVSGDIVGRFNVTVTGAEGGRGAARGGALRATWRYPRPAVELGAFGIVHEPSLGRHRQPGADSLNATLNQGLLAVSGEGQGDGWRARGRLGAGAGMLHPRRDASHSRTLGFGEMELQLQQSRGAQGVIERLRVHGTYGQTRATYQRAIGSLELATTGHDAVPLELGVTYGRITGTPHPFELFAVGGLLSPVGDSSLFSQRYGMAMLPTGIAVGRALFAWRAAIPLPPWTAFYEGASTSADAEDFRKWNRAIGVETRLAIPPLPVAFSPRVEIRQGAAYTLDEPFRKRFRMYLEFRIEP
jgi:hypothetical protein